MLKPIKDYVLLKPVLPNKNNITTSGIYIPDTVRQDQPQIGIVVGIGPQVIDSRTIKNGDKVMFEAFSGSSLEYSNEEYLLVRQKDIYGIIIND